MLVADMSERCSDAVQERLGAAEAVVRKHVGPVGEMLGRAEADLEMKGPVFAEQLRCGDLAFRRDFALGQQAVDKVLLLGAQLVSGRTAVYAVEGSRAGV